ncbi:MAG: hypothetical protein OXG68_16420 [Chloroflexi bacterium]|nr:hypothetical protein [Chloroflexota bacterium]
MDDKKREIARKYMLPERPFLHGAASAFDLFGVLSEGRLENMRDRDQTRVRQSEVEALRAIWQEVADTLLLAIDQYEQESGESGAA